MLFPHALRPACRTLAFCLGLGCAGLAPGQVEAQTLYMEDGEPTSLDEEIRWLLNRARYSRSKENARRGTGYGDIPAKSQPLAPNAKLTRAARNHAEDMARRNRFQHTTVPGSFFYNPSTQPNPWDRMTAEGYVWNLAGENIAAGYESGASVYVGWWNSAGHRHNMFDRDFREIGSGYYYRAAAEYVEYYGMNLGRSGSNRFFTGTLFEDVNGNRTYNRGEGRGGVKVELVVGGVTHSVHDISTAVGSFAIPLNGLSVGATIRVVLTNTTGAPVVVSVPRDQDPLETLVMGPGESRPWGQFVRANAEDNYGFRDAAAPTTFLTLTPPSAVHSAAGGVGFSFAVDGNIGWTAEASESWLRVTGGHSGSEAGTITYELDPHSFGDPRTALITVRGEQQVVKTFAVTQHGVPVELGVGQSLLEVTDSGTAGWAVPVTANVTWTAVESVHWIQFAGASGAVGDGQVSLDVAPNVGTLAREAVVTIAGGGQTRQLTVRQAAGAVRRVGEWISLDLAEGVGLVKKVTGLPPGVVLDRTTGQVSGRATRGGTYFVKVEVQGPDGQIEKRTITLTVSPLPASALGTFELRLARAAGLGNGLAGELRLVVTASGAVSGSLALVGKTHAWRGWVFQDAGGNPEVVATVLRRGDSSVSLRIELRPDHTAVGLATLEPGGEAVSLAGWRRVWEVKTMPVPPAWQGRMNTLFDLKPEWGDDLSVPQGAGYAALNVTLGGRVTWAGRLAEGSVLVRSGWLGPNGESGFWRPLHGGRGSMLETGVSATDGTYLGSADWVKQGPGSSRDRAYPAGFGGDQRGPVGLVVAGEVWRKPGTGQALLDVLPLPEAVENLRLGFQSGVLEDTAASRPDGALTLTRQNRVLLPAPGSPANPSRLIVRVAPATGRVTGEFTLMDGPLVPGGRPVKRRVLFDGLLLPRRVLAAGFFTAPKLLDREQIPVKFGDVVSGLMFLMPNPSSQGG
jgi:hypothetical protein